MKMPTRCGGFLLADQAVGAHCPRRTHPCRLPRQLPSPATRLYRRPHPSGCGTRGDNPCWRCHPRGFSCCCPTSRPGGDSSGNSNSRWHHQGDSLRSRHNGGRRTGSRRFDGCEGEGSCARGTDTQVRCGKTDSRAAMFPLIHTRGMMGMGPGRVRTRPLTSGSVGRGSGRGWGVKAIPPTGR